jgi:2-enoate reductase
VEVHAYGGYLTTNSCLPDEIRKDEYDESFENKKHFLNEIIDGIQSELGKGFPLIVKYTPCHFLPVEYGYRGMEEGIRIAKWLETKGIHALYETMVVRKKSGTRTES